MQKVVVVTGASTGIGYDAVRGLIEKNYLVVPTVRKDEDVRKLINDFGDKVKPVKLDVGDLKQIEQLPKILKEELKIQNIYGLVNNAGVAFAAPFSEQDFSEVAQTINVNVLGLMKTTQVLIPMMGIDSRIINISSVSGKGGAPFLAAYAASKHAVEGFSEALRKELRLYKIKVVVVGPGTIKTPIWNKGLGDIQDKYAKTVFAEPFRIFMKIVASEIRHALPVTSVTDCILDAIQSEDPDYRYAPIPRKMQNWYMPMLIPSKLYNYLTAKTLKLDP